MANVDELSPEVEAVLAHYGVKGMKWGKRKVRPDEADRKARFSPKAKKVALGTAAVAGALAVAYLANKHGGVKVSSLGGLTDRKSDLYSAMTSGKKAANHTMSSASRAVKMVDIPKVQRALASPQMKQVREQYAITAGKRKEAASQKVNLGDLSDVRRVMNDPNFVWEF